MSFGLQYSCDARQCALCITIAVKNYHAVSDAGTYSFLRIMQDLCLMHHERIHVWLLGLMHSSVDFPWPYSIMKHNTWVHVPKFFLIGLCKTVSSYGIMKELTREASGAHEVCVYASIMLSMTL